MQTNISQGQTVNPNVVQSAPVQQQTVVPPHYVQPQPQPQQPPQGQQFAGVNIQIFNPAVGVPGSAPVYNVNAPSYGTGLGQCYPANYYTQQFNQPVNAAGVNGVNGVNGTNEANTTEKQLNNKDTNSEKTVSESEKKENSKKTEKRQIVQLTDDYIKTLENYLNSQEYDIRLMGAKEVVARVQEDESRKDDKALTALTNKMLQDPSQQIRILALSLLDSRAITGDDYTVGVLNKMQSSKDGYGQDALSATNILLKMAGKTVEKEFEVKDTPKKSKEDKN